MNFRLQVYFTNSCQQIWGCLYITFEVKQYYLSYRPRTECFTIFQDKLHSVNIHDDQSWALSETVHNFPKSPIRPAGSRFYSASCQCGRVFELTLIELRLHIIANLFIYLFLLFNGFGYKDV